MDGTKEGRQASKRPRRFFSACLGHGEDGLVPSFNFEDFLQPPFHHLVRLVCGGGNRLVDQRIAG